MISQLMQQPTSFLEAAAAQNIRNMTNESMVFSKRSFVRKCCVYAVKPDVVVTPIPTNTNSAAKV